MLQKCASGMQSARACDDWNLVGEWSHLSGMFENDSCTLRSWLQSNKTYWDSFATRRRQCWDSLYIPFPYHHSLSSLYWDCVIWALREKNHQLSLFDCLVLTSNLLKRFCIALSWHDMLGSASAPVRHFSGQLKKKEGGVTPCKPSPTLCLSVLLWTYFWSNPSHVSVGCVVTALHCCALRLACLLT